MNDSIKSNNKIRYRINGIQLMLKTKTTTGKEFICANFGMLYYEQELIEFRTLVNNALKIYKTNKLDNNWIEQYNDEIIMAECASSNKNNFDNKTPRKCWTHLYLIKDCKTGYIKIGYFIDPIKRIEIFIKELSIIAPEKPKLKLLHTFKCETKHERILHKKFKHKRKRGEWFNLDRKDINQIKNYFKKLTK